MNPIIVRILRRLHRCGFNINYFIAPGHAWRLGEPLLMSGRWPTSRRR